MMEHKNIFVFCERDDQDLADISKELLGCGRALADELNVHLCAVVAGCDIEALAKESFSYGADRTYLIDHPQLNDYQSDLYTAVMEDLVKQANVETLLFGQTQIGRDLAPRLAFRFQTTATMDCTDLVVEPETGLLQMTKPVYGGNVLGIYASEVKPQVATVRAKSMKPAAADPSRKGELIRFPMEVADHRVKTRLVEKRKEAVEGVRLEAAKFVIGGGRGIGSAEAFGRLEQTADEMGGAAGASRAVCDNGWAPTSKQIGLTGRMISPDLYIAVAISGASQHMAGCHGAGTIVAINKDDGANIFREADFGVVGDWNEVLPGFIKKLKELEA